ncbi:MAG TPA: pyridoxamine 5'-phosphate oxidase family protein [Acidimicrobiales bacterium]|nr:pyridoxamine 5'-phosphate oxidase family protein [Acidimicrobiales bacterium]
MGDKWTATTVDSMTELAAIVGEPSERAVNKVRHSLEPIHEDWLANSPFCLIATSAKDGACDVSPKGDPPGFTTVLDERTIAIPDRPGNRRVDGFRNVLSSPQVGLLYLLPGRGDTLRINGRAQLVRDGSFFDRMVVKGHRPTLALVVEVDEVFFHCSKAFLRSELWDPESWQPTALPSRSEIAQRENPDLSTEALAEYYGPSYADRLYGSER